MNFPEHRLAQAALALPALLYGGAVRIRNRFYDRPGCTRSASLPVISLGNLTVGGTGKTPAVQWLCRRLLAEGEIPAVVTRGYGGKAGAGPLVVSLGKGPRVSPDRCGDEPFLLAQTLPGVQVVAGSDRVAGAGKARDLGGTVVILDDGFQHRRLHRDLDVLLLDRDAPLGNGRLLPAGPLREQPGGIGRADLILVTRCDEQGVPAEVESLVRRYNRSSPVLAARHHPAGFRDMAGAVQEPPEKVVAFCGIARPDSFRQSLERTGVQLAAFHPFPDHHRFTGAELADLAAAAGRHQALLVTTEKDLARFSPRDRPALPPLLTLGLDWTVDDPGTLLEAVRRILSGKGGS